MDNNDSNKHAIGIVLVVLGLFLLMRAFLMDVTVFSGGHDIVNLSLLDERRNFILIGISLVALGIFLTATSQARNNQGLPANNPCSPEPPCDRDIMLAPYRIWLVSRYGIIKNETLNSYVCENELFDSAEQAIAYAHSKEILKLAEKNEAERILEESRQAEELARALAEEERKKNIASVFDKIKKYKYQVIGLIAALSLAKFASNYYDSYLFEKYFDADVSLEAAVKDHDNANKAWRQARDSAAKKMEKSELNKISIKIQPTTDNLTYDIVITNNSSYGIKSISGFIYLFSNGIAFPHNSNQIECCDPEILPGKTQVLYTAVKWSRAWSGTLFDEFLKNNRIKVVTIKDGLKIFQLDKNIKFDDLKIKFLSYKNIDPENQKPSASDNVDFARAYLSEEVDFISQAEKLTEVSALFDLDGVALVIKRRQDLNTAKAAWYSWNGFPTDFESVIPAPESRQ